MVRAIPVPRLGALIAAVLAVFVAYGLYSLPNLIRHWGVSATTLPIAALWLMAVATPLLLARSGRPRTAIGAALLGALGLRALSALLVAGRMPPGDAHFYLLLADSVAHGRGLAVFEPFMGVETRALFPPLYPVLLAGVERVVGLSTVSLLGFGLLIDGVAALLIWRLGRALGNATAGLVAAWLYLMGPSILLSAPLAQKEGLCTLLAVLLAVQWVDYAGTEGIRLWRAAAIGVSAGLLALAQPGELPLAALFGLVALGSGVRRLLTVALAAIPVATVVVMTPWWLRNAAIFHTFVPLTSAGGYGLWVGNNPDADGHWMPPPPELRGLPELAFGKAAGRLAIEWITTHPAAFVRVTIQKALRAWGIAEFGPRRLTEMKPAVDAAVATGLFLVSQLTHFALLAAAIAAAWRRQAPGERALLLLVVAVLAQTLCFGAFFEFGERHREFATPFLLLLVLWPIRAIESSNRHRNVRDPSPNLPAGVTDGP